MGRSKQTGKAVLEGMGLGDVSIGTIEGLREFDFGNWDGDLVSEHEKSSEFETFFKDPENFVPIEMQEKIITSLSAESNMLLKNPSGTPERKSADICACFGEYFFGKNVAR